VVYDFDTIIDRFSTGSAKWSLREKTPGMEEVLPLWIADMDFACPPEVVEEIGKRAAHPIYGYTISTDEYYNSLIRWMDKRHRWRGIQRDWISFSPGVVPGVCFAIEAYSHPGDKVIVQPPVYNLFTIATVANGRQIVENPLKIEDGNYVMDYNDLEKKIDKRTKMIILCSPHNPVGRVWKREEIEKLVEICERKDIIIVSDEIFMDLILGETDHTCVASLSEDTLQRTVTLLAPSKTFNLSGLANSSVIIPNKVLSDEFQNVVESHGLAVSGIFGNVFGKVAQEAAYLKGEAWLDELLVYLRENFKFLDDFIRTRIPLLKVYPLEGTYCAWIDCASLSMNNAALREFFLKKAKLWLDEGAWFGSGGSGFVRMNIACPRSILWEALERLERAVHERPKIS